MPQAIDPGSASPIEPAELIAHLDSADFDATDEHSLAAAAPWLAALAANRNFLADLAIAELKGRSRLQAEHNRYSAQVMLIAAPRAGYFIRANFWPAERGAVVRSGGTKPFFYGVAHDHNFNFLTVGYLGPGYWSDYYEHDYAAVKGVPGEPADLHFVERSRLAEGRMLLYRAHRDVHRQLPADSLSISLNIVEASPRCRWLDQYRFDIERRCIDGILSTTSAEALLPIAAHFAGANGIDLAERFAVGHASGRMRWAAVRALAGLAADKPERARLLERAAAGNDAFVAGHARAALAAIE